MMRRSVSFALLALSACSSRASTEPAKTRAPLAHLARFPDLAAHLGANGTLERSGESFRLRVRTEGWQLVAANVLDVTITGTRARLARGDDPGAWIALESGERPKEPEIEGAALITRDVALATDLVRVVERDRFEELRILRDARAKASIRYVVSHGPSIASLRVVAGRVEAVGHDGKVQIASAPAFAVDDQGIHRDVSLRLVGDALEIALDTEGLVYPIVIDPLWTPTPDLAFRRYHHAAAPLPDGRVFVGGGVNGMMGAGPATSAVAFDGTAKTWAKLANLPSPSDAFTLTVLTSGKLLLTGGNVSGVANRGGSVYDPATDSWGSGGYAGGMPYRADVVAALSGDRALAVSQPDALLWDLATTTFAAGGTATINHSGHTATTLFGDRVLVVGSPTSKVAEVWDPATKTFAAAGTLAVERSGHTATLLPSGKVLFVGGNGLSSAELYDPASKTFTSAGAMSTVRVLHQATLLKGDRVLVTGGRDAGGAALSTTEIYDGATNSWKLAEPMLVPRMEHTATVLPGTRVLVVGGMHDGTTLSTAEIFAAHDPGTACADATECSSGFCVDGVCCASACAGQCEACDVAGSVGTCSVVAGAPHGTRTACIAAGTGVCARACDGADRTQCNFAAKTVVCSPLACAGGSSSSATSCDGAGNCPTPAVTDCAPYACGDGLCKTSCAGDADCGGANVCDTATHVCVLAVDSTCSPDGQSAVPTDTSKSPIACAPFACDPTTGKCSTRCTTTSDCATGNACQTASGTCEPLATPDAGGESGGCSVSRSGESFGLHAIVSLAALALRRRRRVT